MALVDYDSSPSSSSEDADTLENTTSRSSAQTRTAAGDPPVAKRPRKLPALPSSFDTVPKDDPSLHQGRTRTRRYVDGEFNTHVYIPLSIPPSLRTTLNSAISSLSSCLPDHTINPLIPSLHVSLTQPLPLRRHQIQSFRDELRHRLSRDNPDRIPTTSSGPTPNPTLTSKRSSESSRGTSSSFRPMPFKLSLAGRFKGYANRVPGGAEGSGGRAFLALRIGAGVVEIKDIVDKIIHPLLEIVHLPRYHENPEFHTSIAWTLIDSNSNTNIDVVDDEMQISPEGDFPESGLITVKSRSPSSLTPPTESPPSKENASSMKTPLTDAIFTKLNDEFEAKILACQPRGGWIVEALHLKVGKEITVIPLAA
ncbi:hypothetical protein IAR55_002307 [Kwoniella newhampshirensis]|uniref:U6 snRNA phosphodiesterase 1 n=1 Tax=Kwoniella newhampshirensis TaxID=1651941 RepID=A0AAW0Z1K4_9TREE